MTEPHTCWIERTSLSATIVASAIDDFEVATAIHLHWIARHHLIEGSGISDDPFPRIEDHGTYLFGILYLPSNPGDVYAEFDEIVFVATHSKLLGTYRRQPRSVTEWPMLYDTLSTPSIFGTEDEPGGITLVRVLKTVIKQLRADAEFFDDKTRSIAQTLQIDLDHASAEIAAERLRALSRRERRKLQDAVEIQRALIARQRAELPLMRRVVVETESILARLANDDLDLIVDNGGTPRQLFTRNLEVFVADAYIDARHVTSVMDAIADRLSLISDFVRQIKDDESVAANRFTGAIASIMLVPTFIVGVYGQNFVELPETSWRFGYLFSWAVIGVVTAGQVWYFRRRRWI